MEIPSVGNTDNTEPKINFGVTMISGQAGGLVQKVERFSAAGQAGVRVGDELLSVNGSKLDPADPMPLLRAAGIGATVTLELLRDGQTVSLQMKLFEKRVLNIDLDDDLDEALERKISPACA